MKDITHTVLDFWLGPVDSDGHYLPQKFWFKSSDDFDAEIRDKFLHVHHDASMGVYDSLAQDGDDYLAIVIVLDQFSRNMFRGQSKAFEADELALKWAQRAISNGYDMGIPAPSPRMFFYLPFDGLVSLYLVSALFGLSQGGIVPSYALIVRKYFPAREAGTRVSAVLMTTVAGMALGGWMSGEIYDLTGSYRAAFINGIVWNLVNMSIAFWILMGSIRGRAVHSH